MPTALDEKLVDVKCAGMKEKKKVSDANGRSKWEILLQEKTLDMVVVDIVYKENLVGLLPEKPQDILVPDVRAEDVSSQNGYIAVRKESALEIKPDAVNLESLDTMALPPEMRPSAGAGNVYLAYRYTQGERSLTLKLTRHVAVEVSSTIIDLMRATFVVSNERRLTANLELYVENARGEQYLALALPKDAVVRLATVNGGSVNPLKREENKSTLIKLASGPTPFWVRIVYSASLEPAEKMGWFGGFEVSTPEVLANTKDTLAPPVNKIEADLYLPEEFAYFNFNGSLHRRDANDVVSNTFEWVEQAVAAPNQPAVAEGARAGLPPVTGINDSFTTIGKQFRFQTLSSPGKIAMTYCDRKLFTLLDVLFFIAVFAAGWVLILKKRYSAFWVCSGFIFVSMCWSWLCTSDFGELPRSALAAGAVLTCVMVLLLVIRWLRDWREERIARAPDPYLEDAVVPAAAVPVPPIVTPVETPPPAAEAPGEKKPDESAPKGGA